MEALLPISNEDAKNHDIVSLSSVRKAIQDVRRASVLLDEEKKEAEEDFLRLLKRMPSPPRSQTAAPTPWEAVIPQVKRYLGMESESIDIFESSGHIVPTVLEALLSQVGQYHGTDSNSIDILELAQDELYSPEEILGYVTSISHESHLDGDLLRSSFPFPIPIFEFIKAAKRVGHCNKKLIAFERGFISKEGIKDREWYKHLGVAPGKWLGGRHFLFFL